jgi:hypothetical protein
MAKAIIEKRFSDVERAKELFSKHFHKGTDLHRELKLFEALHGTRLASKEAASSLVERAKSVCKIQSQAKIDLEKSALLHEINVYLNDSSFFDQEIPEYRDYATVQVLLNHWRGGLLSEHLSEAAQLEDKVLLNLTSKPPVKNSQDALKMTNTDVDGLVVSIMTEKLNKKYDNGLNESQKKILQLYVFSKEDPNTRNELVGLLEGMRTSALSSIEKSLERNSDGKGISSKLKDIQSMLKEDYRDTTLLDDKLVTFYMTVSKLDEELSDE